MKIIASVPILYNGIQYKPGEPIKEYCPDILDLWLENKSVRIEDESIPATNPAADGDSEPEKGGRNAKPQNAAGRRP